jgi:hypothetical protein
MRITNTFTIIQESVRNPTRKPADSGYLHWHTENKSGILLAYKNNIEIARTGNFDNSAQGRSCTKPKWNLVYSLVLVSSSDK